MYDREALQIPESYKQSALYMLDTTKVLLVATTSLRAQVNVNRL